MPGRFSRSSAQLHQSVFFHVDYATPLEPLRRELKRIVEAAPEWDKRTASLVAHLLEEQSKPIGFVLSHAAAKAIDYDGPVPPGFTRGDT